MKKLLKSFAIIVITVLVVSVIPVKVQASAAKKPTLSRKNISVNVGKSKSLTINQNGKKITSVKWSSSDRSVVRVSKKDALNAKIKGISKGTATVTATVKTKSKSYKLSLNVTVKAEKKQDKSKQDDKIEDVNEANSSDVPQEEPVQASSLYSDEELRQVTKDLVERQYALVNEDFEVFSQLFYDSTEKDIRGYQKYLRKETFEGNILPQVLKKKDNVAWVFCLSHHIENIDGINYANYNCVDNCFIINVNGTWYFTYGERKEYRATGIFDGPDKFDSYAPTEFFEAKNAGRYYSPYTGDTYYGLDKYNVLEDCIIEKVTPLSWLDENGDLQILYLFSNGTSQNIRHTINTLSIYEIVSEYNVNISFVAPAKQNTEILITVPAEYIQGEFIKKKNSYPYYHVGYDTTNEYIS